MLIDLKSLQTSPVEPEKPIELNGMEGPLVATIIDIWWFIMRFWKKNTPLPNLVLVSERVHPQNWIWNLNRMVSKRNLLSQGLIFRFYVKLQGCSWISIINSVIIFFNITTLPGLDWESFYLRATSSTYIVWNITRSLNKHIQIHIATSSTWSVTILVPDHFH